MSQISLCCVALEQVSAHSGRWFHWCLIHSRLSLVGLRFLEKLGTQHQTENVVRTSPGPH